jgi:ornithine cyclodeaminase/alanine dehydrogenase-like protein (mu-crystallin family)
LVEAGDLIIPIREGRLRADQVAAELGEIVNGTKPGRTNPEEITYFKSVGVAVQDVAVARRVLRAASLPVAR